MFTNDEVRDMTIGDGQTTLAGDLMTGAAQIAKFLWGGDGSREQRRVYYLADPARGPNRLPTFRMGSMICGRKSSFKAWMSERESADAKAAEHDSRPVNRRAS